MCSEQDVYFDNQSQNAADFVWDFGDGNGSTQSNPTYSYSEAGTYTVTLIANNSQNQQELNCEADAGIFFNGGDIPPYVSSINGNTGYVSGVAIYDVAGDLIDLNNIHGIEDSHMY